MVVTNDIGRRLKKQSIHLISLKGVGRVGGIQKQKIHSYHLKKLFGMDERSVYTTWKCMCEMNDDVMKVHCMIAKIGL